MTRIKICGMTSLADAEQAADLGAWAIGLIHHPDSPRFVEPAVAERIGAALKRRCEIAGVFVNSTLDEVADAAEREGLTLLQFHGEEGPSFCTEAARRTGAKVMKAMRVISAADVQAAEAFRTDFHLFDAYFHGIHGGTGERFDWDLVAKRRSKVPMVLAGGLTPENVGEAIGLAHPYAVDVVTGVEAEPGTKDPAKVEAFFKAVSGDREPSTIASQPGTPAGEAEEVAG
ncbi:MAG TPA: phosphoribosylanthranilate isomerase [Solirubrobacterales bacterium]|nr:phosphoribosylanthranilate isomerase [Solirubrobacterales bacterium]